MKTGRNSSCSYFVIVLMLFMGVRAMPGAQASPASGLAVETTADAASTAAAMTGVKTRLNRAELAEAYGSVPLAFEANQGQTDRRIDFLARGSGYTLFLTPGEVALSLRMPSPARSAREGLDRAPAPSTVLRMKLLDANPRVSARGRGRLPGKTNYFIGKDPAAWRTGVPTYREVFYPEVYPGIDVVYYGNQRRLEHDFIVGPARDPAAIRLQLSGADRTVVDDRGNLVVTTRGGDVRLEKPLLYQEILGSRREVSGGYVLRAANTIGFQIGEYDRTHPLIIDPVLVYSTFQGGSANDATHDIAIDAVGQAHVTGFTQSTDFPTQLPGDTTFNGGGDVNGGDAFVTKLDPSGTIALYSTYLGGSNDDGGFGIGLDPAGNAYVTGLTRSTNFPIVGSVPDSTCGGCAPFPQPGDAFITKLDGPGAIVYSTFVGGSAYEQAHGIAVDSAGNAYITGGIANGPAFCPPNPGAFPIVNGYDNCANSYYDTFITKINPSGTAFLYSTTFGGSNDDYCGCDIEADNAGNAYMTGTTRSIGFPTTVGAYDAVCGTSTTQHVGIFDAIAVKINTNASGSASLVYSTCIGGSADDAGSGIAIDGAGKIWLTGNTPSTNFPTANPYDGTANGGGDAFVVKLDPSVSGAAQLVYGSYLGGSAAESGGDLTVDAGGDVYVVGGTSSSNFPTADPIQTHQGGSDVFVSRLDTVLTGGNQLVFSTFLGGCGSDGARRVAQDPAGNAYLVGATSSASFPTTPGAYQDTYGGNGDGFIAKISATGPTIPIQGGCPDDGNPCNGPETCDPGTGACVSGPPAIAGTPCGSPNDSACDDPDTCNGLGVCVVNTAPDGTTCTDGNACTQTDTCQSGGCVGANPVICTASDQCHVAGICDPGTGVCSNPNAADGTACTDGDACTQTDTCQSGGCVGGNPVICTASDQCHVAGICDPGTGVCSNPNAPDGTTCTDGNACTQTDTCQSGGCVGANPVICTASDQCHVAGICDPGTGVCSNPNAADGTACTDGNACTQTDTCQSGGCVGGNPVICTASDQCHVAGICDPGTGVCSNPNAADGTACTDGNACTQTDTCQSGGCVGGNPVICTASDQCHVAGICDPGTGVCSNPNAPDGTACTDGNACTQTDTCQSGGCVGANPVICTASDQCHVAGICDPGTGVCSNPNAADGTACTDGNACTQTDTCQSGGCVGGNPVICTASDQCHVVGICDPGTGVCSNPNAADGTACTDGNACTQTDTCQSGGCVGGNPVICTASDQCHVAGICDPGTGVCSNPNAPDGTTCTDGNACTQTDTCQSGGCVGANPVICTASDQCHVAGICDPGTGVCSNPNAADGTACTDGNACTQTDTCQSGGCVGGNPVICTASDQCHVAGICDPGTGVCSNPNAPDGTTCTDGNACTQTDTCQSGGCVGANPVICTASDQCHVAGICDPGTGVCSNPNAADGTSCTDGNACTQTDTCQSGGCVGGNPVICTASDQCHVAGICDPGTGVCSNPNAADGTACTDGNACTQTDTCQSGGCVGGNPVICTASDQCHVAGICDPGTGVCSNPNAPDGTTCTDGNACTQTDTCQSGGCVGANPVICTASDQCHVAGICDPGTGVCSNPNAADGTACTDGNACTQTDTCQSGGCVGGNPVICTASDQCHVAGICDPGTGVCSNPNAPDGTACTDGNACTQTDTCQSGGCVGANPVICTASDQCHVAGICDPGTGVCSNPNAADGTACTDGNACTQTDTCQSGGCVGGNPVICTASDQCHVAGICDPGTGVCSNPNAADGTACTDGNACTQTDTCQSGTCAGGPPRNCDDGNQCTTDGCNPMTGCSSIPNPGRSCDDGNACTTNDRCNAAGTGCVGGPPLDCNDGNVCTNDSCNPATGCANACNNTCGQKGYGYWKRLCRGPHGGDSYTQRDVDCVNDTCTFAEVQTIEQMCEELDYHGPDKCEKAEAHYMALLLNMCRCRVQPTQSLNSRCGPHQTAAESRVVADGHLCNPSRTEDDCHHAECASTEITSGEAMWTNSLRVRMEGRSVRLTWNTPYVTSESTVRKYRVWRKPGGSMSPFSMLAELGQNTLSYLDASAGNGNWEYEITAQY